jgi:hypothetical protein
MLAAFRFLVLAFLLFFELFLLFFELFFFFFFFFFPLELEELELEELELEATESSSSFGSTAARGAQLELDDVIAASNWLKTSETFSFLAWPLASSCLVVPLLPRLPLFVIRTRTQSPKTGCCIQSDCDAFA